MRDRPAYGQVRVVPCHGAWVRSVVVGSHLVGVVGHVAQDAVAMRYSARQEERDAVVFAQPEGLDLAKRRRIRPDVGDGSKDLTVGYVHQLLPVFGVQSAEDAAPR